MAASNRKFPVWGFVSLRHQSYIICNVGSPSTQVKNKYCLWVLLSALGAGGCGGAAAPPQNYPRKGLSAHGRPEDYHVFSDCFPINFRLMSDRFPMGFPMDLPRCSHGFQIHFLWVSYRFHVGFPMDFLMFSEGFPINLLWITMGFPIGFPEFLKASIIFL